jgi:hypothetical protein
MGQRATWGAVAAVVAGGLAFATGLGAGGAPRAFGALIASWLFLAGAAMGAVTFRAFFRIVDAGWARPLALLGGGLAAFGPVAWAVLLVILAGAGWAPWIPRPTGWLAVPTLAAREAALSALFFALAWRWFRGRDDAPSLSQAVTWCIAFAVVGSVWAFDFVLGPDPIADSTMVGPYVFMAAFTAGTSLVVLLGLLRGALGERERRDAAALVFALAIFWAYLFCSQYLTSWYANRPEETGYLLRRTIDGWPWVTWSVIGLVWAVPFFGLLHPAGRRSPQLLKGILVAQLLGLWLNCHLLVVPSMAPRGSTPIEVRDLLILLGMLGAFALSVARSLRPEPVPTKQGH